MFRGKSNFKNQEKVVEQRAGGDGKFGKSASLLLQVVIDFDQSFKVYFWKCGLPWGFLQEPGCSATSVSPKRKISTTVTVEPTAPLWSAITWMETQSDSLLMVTVCRRPSARLGTRLRSTSASLLLFNLYLNSNSSSQTHKTRSF